ncbi:MAG: KTSC domain-containing protein [Hyphomicrobiales bacterium]|nr:MAG: KTSC domain-containing protein [Hyphomicrobiales bacterium]
MELVYVGSSWVDQIGFDGAEQEIHVISRKGDHYIYTGCSEDVWNNLLNAQSKGTFINEELKGRGYSFRRG